VQLTEGRGPDDDTQPTFAHGETVRDEGAGNRVDGANGTTRDRLSRPAIGPIPLYS